MKLEVELDNHERLPIPIKELIRELSKLKVKLVIRIEDDDEDNE